MRYACVLWAVFGVITLSGCAGKSDKAADNGMYLQILGSAASESMPSIYCVCDFCQRVRAAGGKNIRFRTAYKLGEDIHIDWGPDSVAQTMKFDLKPWKIKHLFITHSHEDHLFPMDFWIRGVSQLPEDSMLNLYGNQQVLDAVSKMLGGDWKRNKINPILVKAGEPIALPDRQMTVIPLAANHIVGEQALLYVFETPQWRIMIGNDTDVFPPETRQQLVDKPLDVMTIDATWGMERRNEGHLGIPNIVDMVSELKAQNTLTADSRIIPIHFTHGKGALLHSELEEKLASLGMEPAWDGMIIELPNPQD